MKVALIKLTLFSQFYSKAFSMEQETEEDIKTRYITPALTKTRISHCYC